MRVIVDRDQCAGHARCNAVAPEVYPVDDAGYCAITQMQVPVERETEARDGARACPEGAITVED